MAAFERTSITGGRDVRAASSRAKAVPKKDPLASLKMASMLTAKPFLPLEMISQIVDVLDIPDLMRFARVSRRMCEMVYEDSRWVGRLKRMGVWDEEAARRADEHLNDQDMRPPHHVRGGSTNGLSKAIPASEQGAAASANTGPKSGRRRSTLVPPVKLEHDGFDAVTLSPKPIHGSQRSELPLPLQALSKVQSVRGKARREFGKIYESLGSYYKNLTQANQPMSALVFRQFSEPEYQAQLLAQLCVFAKSDIAVGAAIRHERLMGALAVFEAAAVQEVQRGYERRDIRGQMRRYNEVLNLIGSEQRSIDFFLQGSQLMLRKSSYGDPADCLDYSSGHGAVSLEKTQMFFNRLAVAYSEEDGVLDYAFPSPAPVKAQFVTAICQKIIGPYLTALFDEANARGNEVYLKTVAGTFAQTGQFFRDVVNEQADEMIVSAVIRALNTIFEPHLDLYLGAELNYFKERSNAKVDDWDKALSEQAASTETFLMSNVNRQADKKDFLSSFKKVVMMPVNILPAFPTMSANKPAAKALVNGANPDETMPNGTTSARLSMSDLPIRSSTPMQEAPTTELSAKAAIMSSQLEGIRSLFSIEVALDTVHVAKASLERAAQFIRLGNEAGEAAKTQCSAIFMSLLYILGTRHVKSGFDKAVVRLADYNPREIASHDPTKTGVQPLTTFLELVNIADLIQQMLDVFYEQELIGPPVSLDRTDFLSPAAKEKKKFEQMLDERVAAGLSKGIDVLMDEVEYICATTQSPTDYNVPDTGQITDVGITDTAKQVIALVSGHTKMLQGSTDKALLDVFNSEVGLRLFATLCKHLKRQRISTLGSLRMIADMNAYYGYILTLKNPDLLSYFGTLRELGQIYLIDEKDASDVAGVIAAGERWRGVFRAEEVLEFAERRADWFSIRGAVERGLYGTGCTMM